MPTFAQKRGGIKEAVCAMPSGAINVCFRVDAAVELLRAFECLRAVQLHFVCVRLRTCGRIIVHFNVSPLPALKAWKARIDQLTVSSSQAPVGGKLLVDRPRTRTRPGTEGCIPDTAIRIPLGLCCVGTL